MAYIKTVSPEHATGDLAADYQAISNAYSSSFGTEIPVPQVYRTHSIVPAYLHYGAVQIGGTSSAEQYIGAGQVPGVLVNFAVALYSSCFY
jgi:hypothetical protein